MNEDALKMEARLIAIEYMIANLYGMFCLANGATREEIETSLDQYLDQIRGETFEGVDPAQSDLLAAALEEAFERLMNQMRSVALAKLAL